MFPGGALADLRDQRDLLGADQRVGLCDERGLGDHTLEGQLLFGELNQAGERVVQGGRTPHGNRGAAHGVGQVAQVVAADEAHHPAACVVVEHDGDEARRQRAEHHSGAPAPREHEHETVAEVVGDREGAGPVRRLCPVRRELADQFRREPPDPDQITLGERPPDLPLHPLCADAVTIIGGELPQRGRDIEAEAGGQHGRCAEHVLGGVDAVRGVHA